MGTKKDIAVINGSDTVVNVDFAVPARTEALIKMKKIQDLKVIVMLQNAILQDSPEAIEKAVQAGADIDNGKDGKAPILWALLLQRHKAFDALLELGASVDVSYDGISLVLYALKQGDVKAALRLAKEGADTSGYIENIHNDAFRLTILALIQNKTDRAITLEFIRELINRGYDRNKILVNSDVYRTLQVFRYTDLCISILNLALGYGANPNYISDQNTNYSSTPLFMAISCQNKDAVKFLLSAGADCNQPIERRDNQTKYPLSLAIQVGNKEIIELLIQHGASL